MTLCPVCLSLSLSLSLLVCLSVSLPLPLFLSVSLSLSLWAFASDDIFINWIVIIKESCYGDNLPVVSFVYYPSSQHCTNRNPYPEVKKLTLTLTQTLIPNLETKMEP